MDTLHKTHTWKQLQNNTHLSHLVDEFLRTKKSTQTKRAYKQDIETFFDAISIGDIHTLGTVPIHDMSKLIINYVESFKKAETHRNDRVYNPRTLNRKAYALSSFFAYLVANYGYPRNPVKVYTPYSTPDKTSTDDLEKHEVQAIRKYVQDAYTQADTPLQQLKTLQIVLLFNFLILSLRRNEIAHLKWDDWNRKQQYMTIFGKGQKYKYVPLPKKCKEYLSIFCEEKAKAWYTSPYIFSPLRNNRTWDTQKPLSTTYIFTLVKKVVQALQIQNKISLDKNITPHSFRTTFVKMALDSGKTDSEIMNTTWHSTAHMVKYYDSRSPLEVNAASVLDEIL